MVEITRNSNRPRSGETEFIVCSVPLSFEGRFFIFKPGDPPAITVVRSFGRHLIFEIKDGVPVINLISNVARKKDGTVTVSDKASGRFLYEVCPAAETLVVCGKTYGGEVAVLVSEKQIKVAGMIVDNRAFNGGGSEITVGSDGSVGVGSPMPFALLQWFRK